jgi:hypothetical protein
VAIADGTITGAIAGANINDFWSKIWSNFLEDFGVDFCDYFLHTLDSDTMDYMAFFIQQARG